MATHTIDTAHSSIGFTVRHMMFAKVHGQFKKWNATLDFNASDPTKSKLEVDIDTTSIDTREAQRDGHLRSPDFLDSEKFPKMTFKSKRIVAAGAGRYEVVGDLTIRGVTNEVKLDAEQTGSGRDPWGKNRVGFNAKGAIHRSQWGLVWNQALEAGAVLVSDKVEIDVEVQVVVTEEAVAAGASA